MSKEEFIKQTAKDYAVPYQMVETIYDQYMDQGYLLFYYHLEEFIKKQN